MKIAVIHGPNLNLLGQREPSIYGAETLAEVNGSLEALGRDLGVEILPFQSNGEGALVDHVLTSESIASVAGRPLENGVDPTRWQYLDEIIALVMRGVGEPSP